MKFQSIGTAALSQKGKLIIKLDEKLVPLITKGSGIWLKDIPGKKGKLTVEAKLEEVFDSKEELGKIDPENLTRIRTIKANLVEAGNKLSQVSESTETFLLYSILFLAAVTDSLSYLVVNKNLSVFTVWLKEQKDIDNDVKTLLLAYLAPLEGKLGGGTTPQRIKTLKQ